MIQCKSRPSVHQRKTQTYGIIGSRLHSVKGNYTSQDFTKGICSSCTYWAGPLCMWPKKIQQWRFRSSWAKWWNFVVEKCSLDRCWSYGIGQRWKRDGKRNKLKATNAIQIIKSWTPSFESHDWILIEIGFVLWVHTPVENEAMVDVHGEIMEIRITIPKKHHVLEL